MRLKRWEIALLASLLCVLLLCASPIAAQERLAGKLVRLHVLAHSDAPEDQARKLRVRDAVLAASEGAQAVDDALLARIEQAAVAQLLSEGCTDGISVTRTRMWFDTRVYEGFSLPAGFYDAVRVSIGAGEGSNWWCVLFPPLCAGACEGELAEAAAAAGLTEEELALICEDGTGYVIRFKIVELWGKLLRVLGD